MTMFSFRVEESDAAEIQRWADRLGVDRSEFVRQAIRRHLARLRAEEDVEAWRQTPMSDEERSFTEIADWGPAEDWLEWTDASR